VRQLDEPSSGNDAHWAVWTRIVPRGEPSSFDSASSTTLPAAWSKASGAVRRAASSGRCRPYPACLIATALPRSVSSWAMRTVKGRYSTCVHASSRARTRAHSP
jgi:hypothetical protein